MVHSQIGLRCCALLLIVLTTGGAAAERWREPTPAELERLYQRGAGTPAEYLTRLLFYRSANPPRKRFLEARGIRQWPLAPDAPECVAAWRVISSGEWRGAQFRTGELPIGAGEGARQGGTRWFAGADERRIYFAAECGDGRPERAEGAIYENDCVELFLRPEPELPVYWEWIGSPVGNFSALHMLDRDGTRVSRPLKRRDLWQIASTRSGNGFAVEFSIPRSLLWQLKGGEGRKAIGFVMVRIRRDKDGVCRKLVPFPFLYDGHNIFGYAAGVMAVAPESVPGRRGGRRLDEKERIIDRRKITNGEVK